MKVGIFVFETGLSLDPAILAKRAEELGFESFWVPEHPIIPLETTSPFSGTPDGSLPEIYNRFVDPFVALARAAAVTNTIKLGTGVCLVPERNPLILAKEVATLDHFSGGRFIFGIGAGWLREETEIMGGDFDHRWAQTREAVQVMKELWTKDQAEYHGKYYDFPPVRCYPKPAQTPHPPIFLGGYASNVFKRVVAWGDGWMPIRLPVEDIKRGCATLKEMALEAGRDPDSIEVIAFGHDGQVMDRGQLAELEEAGVKGVTIWLPDSEGEGALVEMEKIALRILA